MARSLSRNAPPTEVPPRLCRATAKFYRTGGAVEGGPTLALAETQELEAYVEAQDVSWEVVVVWV